MTNDDLERLVWDRVDGTISSEDEIRLERLLAADASARTRCGELEQMAGGLASIGSVTPPAELRPRIERALAGTSPRWRRSAAPVRMWRARFAYLAAGILLGLVAARLLLPSAEVDRRLAAGAMTFPDSALTLSLERAGQAAIWRTGGSITVVELEILDGSSFEVVMEADSGNLTLSRAELGNAHAVEAVVEAGRVRIEGSGPGRSRVAVGSEVEEAAISVRVMSDGRLVAERLVRPHELRGGR
jgi:hypothetical protein